MIIGGCLALAAIGGISVLRQRRRRIQRCDKRWRGSDAREDGGGDDGDDDASGASEGSFDELYRVLRSSDPAAMGYGSFMWSPASTIISVEPAAAAAASSSWTGDYFDKFDV